MMVVVTINPEKERRDGRALQENKKQKKCLTTSNE